MLKHRGTALEYEGIRKQNQETVWEKNPACLLSWTRGQRNLQMFGEEAELGRSW